MNPPARRRRISFVFVNLIAQFFRCKFFSLLEKCFAAQGCQMVYFQANISNLGKFWKALEWKMVVYVMPIWNISRPFGIFYGALVVLW
jgi:hypothetical protein